MKIKTGTSDAAEVVRVANGLASAGISFRVSFSQFNRETVVVSAFTRDETAHIKYYASNRTQAENVADDLSSVEIANIKDVGQMEFSF